MTPTLVHRYSFPIADAIKALIGDTSNDRKVWSLRIEGDEIIVDAAAPEPPPSGQKPGERAAQGSPADEQSGETGPASTQQTTVISPLKPGNNPEPERKGGAIARQAGIICNEKGFWTFLGLNFNAEISSAAEAANWLRAHCGVTSRADLDHDGDAQALFRAIDSRYSAWLEGYD